MTAEATRRRNLSGTERLLWVALTGGELRHQAAVAALLARREAGLAHAAQSWRAGNLAGTAAVRDDRLLRVCMQIVDADGADSPPAALVLGAIGDGRSFDCLVRALRSSRPWLREAAARGLQRLGNPRAIRPLRHLRRRSAWIDPASGVAAACDRALRSLEAVRRDQGGEMVPVPPVPGKGSEIAAHPSALERREPPRRRRPRVRWRLPGVVAAGIAGIVRSCLTAVAGAR